jgi:hypothetical protein
VRLTSSELERMVRDHAEPATPTALHGHPSFVAGCALCNAERDELVRRLYPPRPLATVFLEERPS